METSRLSRKAFFIVFAFILAVSAQSDECTHYSPLRGLHSDNIQLKTDQHSHLQSAHSNTFTYELQQEYNNGKVAIAITSFQTNEFNKFYLTSALITPHTLQFFFSHSKSEKWTLMEISFIVSVRNDFQSHIVVQNFDSLSNTVINLTTTIDQQFLNNLPAPLHQSTQNSLSSQSFLNGLVYTKVEELESVQIKINVVEINNNNEIIVELEVGQGINLKQLWFSCVYWQNNGVLDSVTDEIYESFKSNFQDNENLVKASRMVPFPNELQHKHILMGLSWISLQLDLNTEGRSYFMSMTIDHKAQEISIESSFSSELVFSYEVFWDQNQKQNCIPSVSQNQIVESGVDSTSEQKMTDRRVCGDHEIYNELTLQCQCLFSRQRDQFGACLGYEEFEDKAEMVEEPLDGFFDLEGFEENSALQSSISIETQKQKLPSSNTLESQQGDIGSQQLSGSFNSVTPQSILSDQQQTKSYAPLIEAQSEIQEPQANNPIESMNSLESQNSEIFSVEQSESYIPNNPQHLQMAQESVESYPLQQSAAYSQNSGHQELATNSYPTNNQPYLQGRQPQVVYDPYSSPTSYQSNQNINQNYDPSGDYAPFPYVQQAPEHHQIPPVTGQYQLTDSSSQDSSQNYPSTQQPSTPINTAQTSSLPAQDNQLYHLKQRCFSKQNAYWAGIDCACKVGFVKVYYFLADNDDRSFECERPQEEHENIQDDEQSLDNGRKMKRQKQHRRIPKERRVLKKQKFENESVQKDQENLNERGRKIAQIKKQEVKPKIAQKQQKKAEQNNQIQQKELEPRNKAQKVEEYDNFEYEEIPQSEIPLQSFDPNSSAGGGGAITTTSVTQTNADQDSEQENESTTNPQKPGEDHPTNIPPTDKPSETEDEVPKPIQDFNLDLKAKPRTNMNNVFVNLLTPKEYTFGHESEMESFIQVETNEKDPQPSAIFCSQSQNSKKEFECLIIYANGLPNYEFNLRFFYDYNDEKGSLTVLIDPLKSEAVSRSLRRRRIR